MSTTTHPDPQIVVWKEVQLCQSKQCLPALTQYHRFWYGRKCSNTNLNGVYHHSPSTAYCGMEGGAAMPIETVSTTTHPVPQIVVWKEVQQCQSKRCVPPLTQYHRLWYGRKCSSANLNSVYHHSPSTTDCGMEGSAAMPI